MLSFNISNKSKESTVADTSDNTAPGKPAAAHPLDTLTGGAFSAATSGERAARVREWLAGNPSVEQMQEVFKELGHKDKGAVKPLREKLDELKRASAQEHIATDWADKGSALLALAKLNIADAFGWQRDAAKAGAPLSKEPLASVKTQLFERVKQVEDLQHRTQVQREAAMMMAQRIEVLSTKPFVDAQAAWEPLRTDVAAWQTQAQSIVQDAQWPSVDAKLAPQLENAKTQLLTLWDAFQAALAQAVAASGDPAAALPAVPVWADAIRAARGQGEVRTEKSSKPKIDPEIRAKATQTVREQLLKLEHELAEGHGKASVAAANNVRAALKEHGAHIGEKLEAAVGHALGAAGELEGWQRWRANQIREELTSRAVSLVKEPLGGRKQQEAVRQLRDAWKQTDQGGVPNHSMWKRFDDACNEAYKLVEAWLEKVKAEEGVHKAQRLQIIENITIWTAENSERMAAPVVDWKDINRVLHLMSEDWRNGGHIGEKAFAELQPLYKAAIKAAHAPLEAAQAASLALRQAMIEEAGVLGAQPMMRIDAVKQLQQRWQAEAQRVPMERKQEQKLWDAFRKPIDDAFNRKTAEREQAAAALSVHDKAVLDAAKTLDAAIASGDAQKIRAAMAGVDAAARGQAVAAQKPPVLSVKLAETPVDNAQAATESVANLASGTNTNTNTDANPLAAAFEPSAEDADSALTQPVAESVAVAEAEATAQVAPVKVAKPVIAMRGDDRPGGKKSSPAPAGRFGDKMGDKKGGKFGDRNDRGPREARPGDNRFAPRDDRAFGARPDDRFSEDRGPRLSNTAFYTQRDALERAQMALKKLASQAHGESLTALLGAWEQRQADAVPSVQELGKAVNAAARSAWVQALGQTASKADHASALLRLEMAAEVPTPAEHLNARRALQLQLLTKRNDPTPAQTWVQDTASVLSHSFDAVQARRLQTVLKALLR